MRVLFRIVVGADDGLLQRVECGYHLLLSAKLANDDDNVAPTTQSTFSKTKENGEDCAMLGTGM
jgi:hypothetical protein